MQDVEEHIRNARSTDMENSGNYRQTVSNAMHFPIMVLNVLHDV